MKIKTNIINEIEENIQGETDKTTEEYQKDIEYAEVQIEEQENQEEKVDFTIVCKLWNQIWLQRKRYGIRNEKYNERLQGRC